MERRFRTSSTGRRTSAARISASSLSSSGKRSIPSTRMARSQVRWLRPTCSSSTRSGVTSKRAANRELRQTQDDRDGAQGLGKAPRARRLLTDDPEVERQRLVDEAGRLAPDPELQEDEGGPIDRRVPVVGQGQP